MVAKAAAAGTMVVEAAAVVWVGEPRNILRSLDPKPDDSAPDVEVEHKCVATARLNSSLNLAMNLSVCTCSLEAIEGIGSSILILLVITSWTYWGLQKRKMIKLKQRFYEQNGGFLLQQQISSHRGATFRIFTIGEIERATNNFDKSYILGHGGHGTVYKGTLDDHRAVAIKKSKMIDESQNREFAKEIFILSQINHRNVVKLLGCCLEVEVPILVYEFISNGTLFHHIHSRTHPCSSPIHVRLRIAAEAAEALSYLHSYASPPIIHGDVKSLNILLDHDYVAKVSDFGASTLIPKDKSQFTTIVQVQGTCGYLDPEYLQTCLLTEKSDVYSFGVVLAEFLTEKKALYSEGSEEERSLALSFVSAVRENKLSHIIDVQLLEQKGITPELRQVSELAMQCLCLKGDERPTMKEVAMGACFSRLVLEEKVEATIVPSCYDVYRSISKWEVEDLTFCYCAPL
ncbi:hypothetical protein Taro_016410 [Colocasia esculenta]|uniref:Protein kinase domain-containing protein n=1 Tax=Colocasia esculenta TaxID=4460 RepID=A0A843UDR6_COLES|nr:hypothetical protein [Colocasia esculenta]